LTPNFFSFMETLEMTLRFLILMCTYLDFDVHLFIASI
jgi:hypothetical protein